MTALLDLNVVLDAFLNRVPWAADSAAVLAASRARRITAHVSAAAMPTIFYIARRQVGIAQALVMVDDCLAEFRIVPVTGAMLVAAQALPGNDYEDNVQIACAVDARVNVIVTRDPKGFAGSPIPVLTPADLVARLATGTP